MYPKTARHSGPQEETMKRILTIAVALSLLIWAIPASAIKVEAEKVEKQDKPAEEPQPGADTPDEKAAEENAAGENATGEKAATLKPAGAQGVAAPASSKKSGGNLLDRLRRSVAESKKAETPKYDQFRDANNDGISDRVPKPASEETAQPATQSGATIKADEPAAKEKMKTTTKPSTVKKKTPDRTTSKKKPQ